jgi:hypothetical protein
MFIRSAASAVTADARQNPPETPAAPIAEDIALRSFLCERVGCRGMVPSTWVPFWPRGRAAQ